jgi:hypothetical protein
VTANKAKHDFWNYLFLCAERQAEEPVLFADSVIVKSAKETIEAGLAGFLGSNSTCPWRNAARRVEAEVYQDLKRYLAEMTELATNPNA